MKKRILLALFLASSLGIFAQSADEQAIQQKIDKIMPELTLEEKASLCSGRDAWSNKPIERLDVPWMWMADGPHGLRRAPATDKGGYGDQLPATCFPTASLLASTWDTALIYRVGQALAQEAQALDVNVLLGPGVNIKRSVLGGRNFEYFSEDPLLAGEMGAAYINGVQSKGVGTSLKHFVANNVETKRMYIDSDVDLRTLHEIYLTPFEIAIKKAQPWTVMACYNRVRGEYGTQSPYLLTEILKEDWGFEGIVISDWEAVVDRVEAAKAGMHIQMPGHAGRYNDKLLVEAVKNNQMDEAVLDNLVREILTIILRADALAREDASQKKEEHHSFARKVAAQGITLLKNDGDILPLGPKKYKKVALIGEFAQAPRYQGNGSSEVKPVKLDKALAIIKDEYGKDVEISYAQGYNLDDDNDFSLVAEAKSAAEEADIAVVFAGLPLHYESEGIDRTHIHLPPSHNKLISEVAAAQGNTVVVLTNGSAVDMPWANDVQGIVESWLGGQAGAGAAADVLFGKVNPSGKLSETFPVRLEDTPAYINFPGEEGSVLYGERMFVGYRHYDKRNIEPLFPFGHGLSYTDFEYSKLQVQAKEFTDKEGLNLSLSVKNTGKVAGKEVVQLYLADKESRLQRPVKELKAFAKVDLNPGESKTVSFTLDARDFSYFDSKREQWVAESGEFIIKIGASSRDIRLQEKVQLNSTQEVPLAFDEYTFFIDYWENDQTREYIKEMMPNWLRGQTPDGEPLDNAQIQHFYSHHPIIKYPYLTDGEITDKDVMELVEKCKKLKVKL